MISISIWFFNNLLDAVGLFLFAATRRCRCPLSFFLHYSWGTKKHPTLNFSKDIIIKVHLTKKRLLLPLGTSLWIDITTGKTDHKVTPAVLKFIL